MSSLLPVNCTNVSEDVNATANCSLFSWGVVIADDGDDSCSANAYMYTGGVCWPQLLAWQECAVGNAEVVFLDSNFTEQSQQEKERDASRFFHFLSKLIDTCCH